VPRVLLTPAAARELRELSPTMKRRVQSVFVRLESWPATSGAKPLSHALAGTYRIRTGDWRVLFRLVAGEVLVERIAHRSEVYDSE
jgi:mRNA interferase RelE/StbE